MQHKTNKTDKINIDELAGLARLSLTPAQAERFEKDISELTEYVCVLEEYSADTQVKSECNGREGNTRADVAAVSGMKVSQFAATDGDGYIAVPLTVGGKK